MKYIMTNFNHERLSIAVNVTRQARVALSSAFEYVMKREAFGRPLMDQPVVRHRLAKAGALLESQWAWVEQFAYQLTQMKKEESDAALGGLTGLLKANAGIVLKECADTAVLLFGGNGYTLSGQGELVESTCLSMASCLGASTCANPIFCRTVARGSRRKNPWRVRRRLARSRRASARQDIQGQDDSSRRQQAVMES